MSRQRRDAQEAEPFLGDDDDSNHGDGISLFPDIETEEHPWIGEPGHHSTPRARWQPKWARPSSSGWTSKLRVPRLPVLPAQKPIHTIILLTFIKGAAIASALLLLMPISRLIEDAFCHEHYGKELGEPIDEMECKVDDVQTKLAFVGALGMLIGAILGLVVAVPYGIMADRVGRKPTLLLSYFGIMLSFSYGPLLLAYCTTIPPLWVMLFGSIFNLIGGGVPVLLNTLYSMASDVSTEETRSSNFLYMSIGAVVASLAAPATAGFLMERFGPWLPIKLIFWAAPLLVVAMLALPETLSIKLGEEGTEHEGRTAPNLPFKEHVRNGLKDLREAVAIAKNRNIILCLVPPLIGNALWSVGATVLGQYISKYYGWTLAQVSILLSPMGLVNIAVLAAMPMLSARLVDPAGRYRMTAFRKDLVLLRLSFVFMAAAYFIQGLSWNFPIFLIGMLVGTAGTGSPALARAVASEFVDKEETSRLYALISIMDMLGAFIGAPVVAGFFTLGMKLGGVFRGLPFFYAGLLVCGAMGAMHFVKEPKKPRPAAETEDEAGEGRGDLGYESAPEDA